MSTAAPTRALAPFCRLCLTKTSNTVPIFGPDEANVINLLMLIELDIDPDNERNASVCFECILTLEGFYQFKEKCHVNDELLKTLPPKETSEGSEDEDPTEMHNDYLENETVEPAATVYESSDEEGLVKDCDYVEALTTLKRKFNSSEGIKPEAKQIRHETTNLRRYRKPVETRQLDPKELKKIGQQVNVSALDKLQVLQDSYPDYFHFERGSRSVYFTLVFYGERYNSASYNDTHTVWQCANRRRFQCPAQVRVTNDYTEFERRFEHTHGEIVEKEQSELFTPKQALPELFKLCRQFVMKRKVKGRQNLLKKKMQLEMEATKMRRNLPEAKAVDQNQVTERCDNNSLLRAFNDGDEDGHDDDFVEYDSSDSSCMN